MCERLAGGVADGNFCSPEVDLEREAAAIETWFSEHGYTC
jgi:hypothetical protein